MPAVSIDPPLSVWYCDECRLPITDVNLGTVSWKSPTDLNPHDGQVRHDFPEKLFVLHKGACDDSRKLPKSYDLNFITGPLGVQVWSEFLWRGPKAEPMDFVPGVDMKPVMELFYRLFVPYYEQARRHFKAADVAGFLDGRTIFDEHDLKKFIEDSIN